MQRILLLISMCLLLSGCGHVEMYKDKESTISFQYPSGWEVQDTQTFRQLVDGELIDAEEKFEHATILKMNELESIFFDYNSISFDEYENSKQSVEPEDGELGGFLVEEFSVAGYPGRKYTEYGVELAGISYVVEKNGRFLSFSTEYGLSDDQLSGIEQIVDSIKFE